MNQKNLSLVEARILLMQDAIAALEERMKTEPSVLYGSKETGAVRRASLDLTRALADLRRPE